MSCLGDTSPEEETQELREVAAMGFRNFRCRVKHPLSLEGDGQGGEEIWFRSELQPELR